VVQYNTIQYNTIICNAHKVEYRTSWYAHHDKKKSRRRRALKPLEIKSSKNSQRRVLWHTTMPVNLVKMD